MADRLTSISPIDPLVGNKTSLLEEMDRHPIPERVMQFYLTASDAIFSEVVSLNLVKED